jgi:Tol biopolymer transport system component
MTQQEDMRMTRSLNQTGRRAVLAAVAACAAMAGTLGLASGAEAAMVYISTRQLPVDGTSDFEIWKASDTGTSPVQLTNNSAWDERPSISVDGTKVVFASKRDGNWEIYRMDSDGSNQTRLTTSTNNDTRPVWSPDGTRIAWQRQAGSNQDIWVMNQDGSDKTQLTTHTAVDIAPAWHNAGIAFVSNRNANNHNIWRMSGTGANVTQLTTAPEEEFDPSWYDGDAILYTRNNSSSRDIYEVDAFGSGAGDSNRINFSNTSTRDECDAARRGSISSIAFTNLSVGGADIWGASHSGSGVGAFGSGLNSPTTNDQQVAWQAQVQ